jgi:hypothetical protein
MSPLPNPLDDAWSRFRARAYTVVARLLARALPAALAAGKGLVTRLERRAILAWIRPLEAVARTLIFGEALLLPAAPAVASMRRRGGAARGARHADGGVRDVRGGVFNLGLGVVLGGGGDGGPGGPRDAPDKDELVSAWPLAERLEIVLDALEDPAPHVARAASRLGLAAPNTQAAGRARDGRGHPRTGPPGGRARGLGVLAQCFLEAESQTLLAEAAHADTS